MVKGMITGTRIARVRMMSHDTATENPKENLHQACKFGEWDKDKDLRTEGQVPYRKRRAQERGTAHSATTIASKRILYAE
jgi:hypothetical protein